MIRNFLKTIGRNIKRSKTFSFLNIIGLAIGIACAAIIFLWVEFYLNFNHSIKNFDNLYNVKNTQTYGKDVYTFSSTALLTKDILENKLSGVTSASRYNSYGATISVGEKYTSHSGAYVDSAFMDMFDFPMVAGNRSKALNHVNQIAISEKLAENYFAGQDAMSKTIMVDKQPYIVSAVFKKRSKNTSFNKVEFLIPFDVFYAPHKGKPEDIWGNNWTDTWVMLSSNVNVEKANQQLKSYIKKTYPESNNSIFLYPLNKMVLYGQFVNGKEDISSGYIKYIKMFSLIAIIILIIACINFMNLSTARSEKRSKEIGIRKVLGSSRKALIGKLLMESIAIAYNSVLLAVLIIAIVLPMFNQLVHIPLKMELFKSAHLIFLVVIGFFAGILAGSYPALYLSSFNPISALKRQVYKIGGGAINIRKVLVVFQFAISIIIIFSMIVIYQQIQFSKNRDLGFNRNNILSVD
ncbi:MAG: acetylornithine deacetylase, partial [Pseudopedobacter saltans]